MSEPNLSMFTRDGIPISFYLRPCKTKEKIAKLIMEHGGIMTGYVGKATYILYNPGDVISLKDAVSTAYIEDSIRTNTLLNVEQYRYVNQAQKEQEHRVADVQETLEGCSSRSFRRSYTLEEDMVIIRHALKYHHRMSTNGERLWDMLAAQKVVARTSLSLKERFIKKILPFIDSYNLTASEKRELKSLMCRKAAKLSGSSQKKPLPFADPFNISGDDDTEPEIMEEPLRNNKEEPRATATSQADDVRVNSPPSINKLLQEKRPDHVSVKPTLAASAPLGIKSAIDSCTETRKMFVDPKVNSNLCINKVIQEDLLNPVTVKLKPPAIASAELGITVNLTASTLDILEDIEVNSSSVNKVAHEVKPGPFTIELKSPRSESAELNITLDPTAGNADIPGLRVNSTSRIKKLTCEENAVAVKPQTRLTASIEIDERTVTAEEVIRAKDGYDAGHSAISCITLESSQSPDAPEDANTSRIFLQQLAAGDPVSQVSDVWSNVTPESQFLNQLWAGDSSMAAGVSGSPDKLITLMKSDCRDIGCLMIAEHSQNQQNKYFSCITINSSCMSPETASLNVSRDTVTPPERAPVSLSPPAAPKRVSRLANILEQPTHSELLTEECCSRPPQGDHSDPPHECVHIMNAPPDSRERVKSTDYSCCQSQLSEDSFKTACAGSPALNPLPEPPTGFKLDCCKRKGTQTDDRITKWSLLHVCDDPIPVGNFVPDTPLASPSSLALPRTLSLHQKRSRVAFIQEVLADPRFVELKASFSYQTEEHVFAVVAGFTCDWIKARTFLETNGAVGLTWTEDDDELLLKQNKATHYDRENGRVIRQLSEKYGADQIGARQQFLRVKLGL